MSSQPAGPEFVPGETEALIRETVALLAQACHEDGMQRERAARQRRRLAAEQGTAANPMRDTARHLTNAVKRGDQPAIDRQLSRPRNDGDWRYLTQILAAAAREYRVWSDAA